MIMMVVLVIGTAALCAWLSWLSFAAVARSAFIVEDLAQKNAGYAVIIAQNIAPIAVGVAAGLWTSEGGVMAAILAVLAAAPLSLITAIGAYFLFAVFARSVKERMNRAVKRLVVILQALSQR